MLGRDEISTTVQLVLRNVVQQSGRPAPEIDETSNLLADLGLSSLDLPDIAVGLEEGLRLREFPIDDWLKAEGMRTDPDALTVRSLVEACRVLVADPSAIPSDAESSKAHRRSQHRVVHGTAPERAANWTLTAMLFVVLAVVGLVVALTAAMRASR